MSTMELDVKNTFKPSERRFCLPNKLMVGAGPTNYSPRVVAAMNHQSVGPVCEEIYKLKDEIRERLKYVFQTKNEVTLALQTSGSGGLEAALVNVVEPGETILVPVGGLWGDRIVQIAKDRNINVVKITTGQGEVFTLEELENNIRKYRPVLVFMTHGESSGGTIQPLEGLKTICHKYNTLLAVDAVVSLGGVPFFTDRWGVDIAVSATQKAIGAPPGLAFITCSTRAVKRMRALKTKPPFYFNILNLGDTWNCFGNPRKYHVTYNPTLLCAAREALSELAEEGLENSWKRHRYCMEKLWKGCEELGLEQYVEKPENRLITVCSIWLPKKVQWPVLLEYLNDKYQVEISFGIGPTLNKAMRIGLMGCNARPEVVEYVLKILDEGIQFCKSEKGQNYEHRNKIQAY